MSKREMCFGAWGVLGGALLMLTFAQGLVSARPELVFLSGCAAVEEAPELVLEDVPTRFDGI